MNNYSKKKCGICIALTAHGAPVEVRALKILEDSVPVTFPAVSSQPAKAHIEPDLFRMVPQGIVILYDAVFLIFAQAGFTTFETWSWRSEAR